ncbi:CBS domain-containing protein [Acidobacteria bacterium Mor1]|nr:CBS domain-containing protein [Acidobacteria bacterium Mor1]
MLLLVVSVTAAIVTSAMCSLFEAVLYSVPDSHVDALKQQGRGAGETLRRLRENVDRPIAAILSLNTIANTAGAAVAGYAAASVFGEEKLIWFSAVFTVMILIFSEVIPKTAGVVHSRVLAPMVAGPLNLLVKVFTPFVWLCRAATLLISRGGDGDEVSEKEIIFMARSGLKAGSIRPDEAQVIENILDLDQKRAREIMTPRAVVASLPQNLSAEEARSIPGTMAHSRLPVYDSNPDDVVGLVHRRDLLAAVADGKGEVSVGDLIKPVHFVVDTARVHDLMQSFIDRRQHLFVVIDEHGGVAGVVTLEDVLEEVLGTEIVDEFDEVADLREAARRRRMQTLGPSEMPGSGDRSGD